MKAITKDMPVRKFPPKPVLTGSFIPYVDPGKKPKPKPKQEKTAPPRQRWISPERDDSELGTFDEFSPQEPSRLSPSVPAPPLELPAEVEQEIPLDPDPQPESTGQPTTTFEPAPSPQPVPEPVDVPEAPTSAPPVSPPQVAPDSGRTIIPDNPGLPPRPAEPVIPVPPPLNAPPPP